MTNFDALRQDSCKRYPPERAAQICGVERRRIREVARLWGEAGAGVIFWGMGICQHTTGTDNARCLIALCSLTGNVGRPGTGLHPLRGQNNVQGASDAGPDPDDVPRLPARGERRGAGEVPARPGARELDPQPGLTVVEIIGSALEGGVRGMYMMGENPFLSDPNVNKVRKALAALEFLVVQDIFLTETAEFADVVLPGLVVPREGRHVHEHRPPRADRAHGARPARRGAPRLGDHPRDLDADGLPMDYEIGQRGLRRVRRALARLRRASTTSNLGPAGKLYPCPDPEHSDGTVVLFGESFPTDDGKAHLVPAEWMPAKELPDDEYPFVLNTGRLLEHWHTGSMTRRALALDAIQPAAMVFVDVEADARAARHLRRGLRARVARGAARSSWRRSVSHRETPGTFFIPFHFREAAANLLTIDALDPFGKIPEFKFCAVKVERVGNGAAPLPDPRQAPQGAG